MCVETTVRAAALCDSSILVGCQWYSAVCKSSILGCDLRMKLVDFISLVRATSLSVLEDFKRGVVQWLTAVSINQEE